MPENKIQTNDAAERQAFKDSQAERIQKKLTEQPTAQPVEKKFTVVTVPLNFHSLSDVELYGIVSTTQNLTPEQAASVVEHVRGRYITDQFTIALGAVYEPTAKPVLTSTAAETHEPRTVALELPWNFETLAVSNKFLWLTKESPTPLSFEEANDVIDMLVGKPTYSGTRFELSIAAPTPQEQPVKLEVEPVAPKPVPVSVTDHSKFEVVLPENFASLTGGEQYWHLVTAFKLSYDEANAVLDDYAATSAQSFTVDRTKPEEPAKALPADPGPVVLALPHEFRSLTSTQQYMFLQAERKLPPAQASDVLALLGGRRTITGIQFEISFDEPVPAGESPIPNYLLSRAAQAAALASKVSESIRPQKVKPEFVAPTRTVEINEVTLRLPAAFKTLTLGMQHMYLQDDGLLPEQASDVIATLNGTQVFGNTRYTVVFDDPIAEANPVPDYLAKQRENAKATAAKVAASMRPPKEKPAFVPPARPEPKLVSLTLPHEFGGLSPAAQHLYLQSQAQLTTDMAADVLAVMGGSPSDKIRLAVTYGDPVANNDNPVASYKKPVAPTPAVRAPKAKPAKPTQSVAVPTPKPTPVKSVQLPHWFSDAESTQQFTYLTRTKQMLPEDASELIAHLSGFKTTTVFNVEIEESGI